MVDIIWIYVTGTFVCGYYISTSNELFLCQPVALVTTLWKCLQNV